LERTWRQRWFQRSACRRRPTDHLKAFQTNKLNLPAVERARPLDELVSAVLERIEPLRANADYAGVGALLPDVLDELHWNTARSGDEAFQRVALETLIEACITAGLTARNLGYIDLAHVAVLRAEEAATLLDDPVQQGKVAYLLNRATAKAGGRELRGMAARMGLPH
jgi:hypothetical protein